VEGLAAALPALRHLADITICEPHSTVVAATQFGHSLTSLEASLRHYSPYRAYHAEDEEPPTNPFRAATNVATLLGGCPLLQKLTLNFRDYAPRLGWCSWQQALHLTSLKLCLEVGGCQCPLGSMRL